VNVIPPPLLDHAAEALWALHGRNARVTLTQESHAYATTGDIAAPIGALCSGRLLCSQARPW
jgi:hypothetical protein